MRSVKMISIMMGLLLLSGIVQASGRTIRATDMGSIMWSDLTKGKLSDVIVEFRQGDELPVTFEAQGDLLETKQASVSYVGVKKNFWLRLKQNNVEISMDGAIFKKLSDVLTGSLEAGAGSEQNDGIVDNINIVFKTFIK